MQDQGIPVTVTDHNNVFCLQAPDFLHLALMDHIGRNHMLADIVAIIGKLTVASVKLTTTFQEPWMLCLEKWTDKQYNPRRKILSS